VKEIAYLRNVLKELMAGPKQLAVRKPVETTKAPF